MMLTLLKFSPRFAYSALDLVNMPIPTSMPTLTRKLGSANRRSRKPLQDQPVNVSDVSSKLTYRNCRMKTYPTFISGARSPVDRFRYLWTISWLTFPAATAAARSGKCTNPCLF